MWKINLCNIIHLNQWNLFPYNSNNKKKCAKQNFDLQLMIKWSEAAIVGETHK